jgi:hypothetical protein
MLRNLTVQLSSPDFGLLVSIQICYFFFDVIYILHHFNKRLANNPDWPAIPAVFVVTMNMNLGTNFAWSHTCQRFEQLSYLALHLTEQKFTQGATVWGEIAPGEWNHFLWMLLYWNSRTIVVLPNVVLLQKSLTSKCFFLLSVVYLTVDASLWNRRGGSPHMIQKQKQLENSHIHSHNVVYSFLFLLYFMKVFFHCSSELLYWFITLSWNMCRGTTGCDKLQPCKIHKKLEKNECTGDVKLCTYNSIPMQRDDIFLQNKKHLIVSRI